MLPILSKGFGLDGNKKKPETAEDVKIETTKLPRGDENTQKLILKEENENRVARTHLSNIRLTEVTSNIFALLKKGEICRYGNTGWMVRCPECERLLIMEDDTHKTYISPDNSIYRLSPSLVCPHQDCNWHVFAVVIPEFAKNVTEVTNADLEPSEEDEQPKDQQTDDKLVEADLYGDID